MQPGTVLGQRFRIIAPIGRGAMGVVFRADDLHDGSVTAVKLVEGGTETEARRFMREASVLARLTHPAIVQYRAHGMAPDGRLFLAMEWIDGTDLGAAIAGGGLSPAESVQTVSRIAGALAVVHDAGVVHRDLKPANILLAEGDPKKAKLVDFGVAHVSRSLHAVSALTKTGAVVGTPAYLAPEQINGVRVDGRTDLFALGCVLFECLTGRPAFVGANFMALISRILAAPSPRVREVDPDIPAPLDDLVAGLLEKEPDARPPSARVLLEALASLAELPSRERHGDDRQQRVFLTPREQRLVTVVFAGSATPQSTAGAEAVTPSRHARAQAMAQTLETGEVEATRARLDGLARAHAAHLTLLPDGSALALMDRLSDTPAEQVLRAARLALEVVPDFASHPVVVATGRGEVPATGPAGEAIDRAAQLLESAPPGHVVIDADTAGLLRGRFELEPMGDAYRVLTESQTGEPSLRLLGKPTPFVGRRRELALLTTTLEECVEERSPRALLVTADPGQGKTRLLQEFLDSVRHNHSADVAFLVGRGDPMRTGSAYGMLAPAIRAACNVIDGDPIETQRERILDRVGPHGSDDDPERVAAFLGELVAVPWPTEGRPGLAAARFEPTLMSEQVQTSFVDWVAAECARGPRIVVLEDLHWGDLSTVRLIENALQSLRELPLMVLALARPSVHDVFPRLWAQTDPTELKLGKLSPHASRELARAALPAEVPDVVLDRLVERADGNPFFLEELIRGAADRDPGVTMPDTVLGMVEARVFDLEPTGRLLLRAASVFGETFWRGGIDALLDADATACDVPGWLSTLVAEELLTPHPQSRFAGDAEYGFRHGLIRDACYATLTGEDRRAAHRLAAIWLESQGERDAGILAEHFERGAEALRAVDWYVRAAEQALRANDLEGALRCVNKGVACGASGEPLGRLKHHQSEAFIWMGKPAEGKRAAEDALELLAVGSDAWCTAVADLGDAAAALGSFEGVDSWIDVLIALRPDSPHAGESRATALARLSFGLILVGRLDAAGEIVALADVAAQALDDDAPFLRAHLAHARAAQAMMRRDRLAAARSYAMAADAFEDVGAQRLASGARTNVGAMYIELGAYERARDTLDKALAVAKRARSAYSIRLARLNLALALSQLGEVDRALDWTRQVIEDFRAQGDVRLEASAEAALSEMYMAQGDLDAAEKHARRAHVVAADLPPAQAAACAVLAQVVLRRGQPTQALAIANEGMALSQISTMEERETLLRLTHAEALAATGEAAKAGEAFARLAEEVRSQANRIEEVGFRRSFLENVPENARVLENAGSLRPNRKGSRA